MDDFEKKMYENQHKANKSKAVGQLLDELNENCVLKLKSNKTSWTVRVDYWGNLIIRVYVPGVTRILQILEIIHRVGLYGYYYDGDRGKEWMEIIVFMERR